LTALDRGGCVAPMPAARAKIEQLIQTAPASLNYIFGFWTVVTLTAHLASQGLQLSRASLRRVLHALDYRWRRPRHAFSETRSGCQDAALERALVAGADRGDHPGAGRV